ncbi:MAG: SUMF1/EgtB/PvdO family nonheme iron enzyme [Victivallales bacterium]|nr:SUMF1/EgtB/PvdO family nonheme iron enzyme [Victivallales bacterium]
MMNRKNWIRLFIGMIAWLMLASNAQADVKVTNIELKPHWPWNGLVDIIYSVTCDENDLNGEPFEVRAEFEGYDAVLGKKIILKSLTGDGVGTPVKLDGPNKATWDAAKDYPTINTAAFQVKIHASVPLYMVVDLSGGPDATSYPVRYTGQAPNLDDDTCRTTELWLRRIPAGKFLMGSPNEELGHKSDETLHEVTLTKSYYIGIFECTVKQLMLVMKENVYDYIYSRNMCDAVDKINYRAIRNYGTSTINTWPDKGHSVDSNSFMGKLQTKTGLTFDLPTEAQWEYACKAGTTTALNSGKNLTVTSGEDVNLNEMGRYAYNRYDGRGGSSTLHTKVGSYLPNTWGLYDMHGNVLEWCLDWYGNYSTIAVSDPTGPTSGSARVLRGGFYNCEPSICRSATRFSGIENLTIWNKSHYCLGFRIVCMP